MREKRTDSTCDISSSSCILFYQNKSSCFQDDITYSLEYSHIDINIIWKSYLALLSTIHK